jgi:hypothetical protein
MRLEFATAYDGRLQVFYTSLLPVLDRKAITVVFANVEDLLLTNTVTATLPLFQGYSNKFIRRS